MPNHVTRCLLVLSVLSTIGSVAPAAGDATAERPNVVFILADDLGWRDTSIYGSEFHETPNIDRLAARGMRFTQAYAANPLCSPTRASIQTGLWPARIGITSPACHLPQEVFESKLAERAAPSSKLLVAQSATRLKHEYYTLAEALHDAGYATGHFGKWHLGMKPYDALHHGFDVDVPNYHGPGPAGSYLAPWRFPEALGFHGSPGEHIEDRMADEAVKWIHANKDQPFYLNYWAFSVHAPHGGKPELISKYEKKADPAARQRNPIYGAMVESLDDAVGRLLDTLDELRLADKTIIVFFSDNGGIHFQKVGDSQVTDNYPLRGGKATTHEGGTREPCIVVWPGVTQPNSTSDAVIQSIDFYPSLLQMTSVAAKPGQRFDGMSIVPALRGEKLERDAIYCHFPHTTPAAGGLASTYVRQRDWKLIRFYGDNADGSDRYELYNLKDDLGETNNLAAAMRDKVAALDALIDGFLQETGAVVPRANPEYDPNYKPAAKSKAAKAAKTKRKKQAAPRADEQADEANTAPNIIYILADDLGYGDLKCLNPDGKLATPHMDRLAAEGMIFTDAHSSSSVCTPTRYGILTGRYNWRSRLERGVLGGLSPRLIEQGRLTVPALLKQHGYQTACIGKWHLGMDWVVLPGKEISELSIEKPDQVANVDYARPITNGPQSVGFDYYYGISASLDMVPYTYVENDRVTVLPTATKSFPMITGRAGTTTRLGPAAPEFEAANVLPDLSSAAVSYIDRQAAAAKQGTPFFLYLPLASPHTPINPSSDWLGRSKMTPYGDFVMQTDWCVGQVLEALDRHALVDNTLIVFTSDNGHSPQADYPSLAEFGHASSHRFRGNKADIFEGGHRVPFVVRWPARIQAGSQSDQTVCLVDLMSTCADIVGATLPDDAGEDSASLLPILTGSASGDVHEAVVHHSINGSFAIRQGNWKLCLCPDSGGWSEPRPSPASAQLPPVQLFDLSSDIGEKRNVADEHPQVVARLTKLLERIVADGRGTPGKPQKNSREVNIWAAVGN